MTAIADRVQGLAHVADLSQAEVARIVGASPRTVARWVAGEVVPQPDARDRLLRLNYVANQLVDVLGLNAGDANVWIFEPNSLLQGDSPADRLTAGDFRTVLGLIEAIADGIVV